MALWISFKWKTFLNNLQNLKYWRHRMYLLPKEHSAYKKILETASPSIHCDIFVENSIETPKQIIDDFKSFLESYLNKIKKLHCPKMTKVMNRWSGKILDDLFDFFLFNFYFFPKILTLKLKYAGGFRFALLV